VGRGGWSLKQLRGVICTGGGGEEGGGWTSVFLRRGGGEGGWERNASFLYVQKNNNTNEYLTTCTPLYAHCSASALFDSTVFVFLSFFGSETPTNYFGPKRLSRKVAHLGETTGDLERDFLKRALGTCINLKEGTRWAFFFLGWRRLT